VGFVVAIDGPAASGKGTIASRLGRALGLPVLDTGLLYRAVGVAMRRAGANLADEDAAAEAARGLNLDDLDAAELRTGDAGEAASRVAAYPAVRLALLDFQRAFAGREPGAILDGRDIGAVVAPAAPCKLFVTASPETRARRRQAQLLAQGEASTYEAVLEDIRRRDARDRGRAAAPLVRVADAVLLDTTDLDIDAAFDAALRIVEASRGRWETSRPANPIASDHR
jgi:cytidylate kinase